MTDIFIEPYRGKKAGRQVWRWRAVYGGNHRKVANGGEAYSNKADMEKAIGDLFGSNTTVTVTWPNEEPQVLRQPHLSSVTPVGD